MSGKVAAVDRRHVVRRQRFQGQGVVPVIEVALVPLKAPHRPEGVRGALEKLARGNVTKVIRSEIRQQRKPYVGGRGAVRDDGDRMLLVIVRRQPVVFLGDKGLEECPRPAREPLEENDLLRAQPGRPRLEWPAEPPGDGGSGEPQAQHRRSDGQRGGLRPCKVNRDARGDGRRNPHRSPGAYQIAETTGIRIASALALDFARRTPLQQPAPREQQAHPGTRYGAGAEPGFEREAGQRKGRLCELAAG